MARTTSISKPYIDTIKLCPQCTPFLIDLFLMRIALTPTIISCTEKFELSTVYGFIELRAELITFKIVEFILFAKLFNV